MKLPSLVLASVASATPLASAQPAGSNSSVPPISAPLNSSHGGHAQESMCHQTYYGVDGWYYDSRSWGPYNCYGNDFESWGMLRAYRSGGSENVHWKYTDNKRDPECLYDWVHYAEDGERVISIVSGRTLVDSNNRRWCGLPVYRSGGVKNKQWEWCNCWK